MKNIINAFIVLIVLTISSTSQAQQVNWRNLTPNNSHLISVYTGWDYGTIAGIGYGQRLNTTLPMVLNMEYSCAFGKTVFDDFKIKLGGQAEVLKINNFSASIKAYGLFRRYENELVRLLNFGSEFAANIGYYKTKWYVAGEFGFDKAIVTHIKNSEEMKSNYPGSQDGWYVPTGGNFFYGVISGYSFNSNDVYVKIGKTVTQDFTTTATVPVYLQIGYNRRF